MGVWEKVHDTARERERDLLKSVPLDFTVVWEGLPALLQYSSLFFSGFTPTNNQEILLCYLPACCWLGWVASETAS